MSKSEKVWSLPTLRKARIPEHILNRLEAEGVELEEGTVRELRDLLRPKNESPELD